MEESLLMLARAMLADPAGARGLLPSAAVAVTFAEEPGLKAVAEAAEAFGLASLRGEGTASHAAALRKAMDALIPAMQAPVKDARSAGALARFGKGKPGLAAFSEPAKPERAGPSRGERAAKASRGFSFGRFGGRGL